MDFSTRWIESLFDPTLLFFFFSRERYYYFVDLVDPYSVKDIRSNWSEFDDILTMIAIIGIDISSINILYANCYFVYGIAMPSSGFNDTELNYGCLTPASEGVVKAGTNGDEYFVALARHSVSVIRSFIDINLCFAEEIFDHFTTIRVLRGNVCRYFVIKRKRKRKSLRWKISVALYFINWSFPS